MDSVKYSINQIPRCKISIGREGEALKIPFQEYTFGSFVDRIMQIDFPVQVRLKVACFFTQFDNWDTSSPFSLWALFNSRGFRIDQMGEIRVLSKLYFDTQLRQKKMATFYAYLNSESKLLLLFTDEKAEAIDQTVGEMAETASGIYCMFTSPRTLRDIRSKIMEGFPSSVCFYFTAKHFSQFARKGETRPHIDRTIVYFGDDALQALEELQQYYGVSPRIMRYRIPDVGSYEIKNTGCFTLLKTEDPIPAKQLLMRMVDWTSVLVLRSRQIIERSDFILIPLKTEEKTFEIPKLIPWAVRFSKALDNLDAESLMESMVSEGYTLFNYVMPKGSFRLNGMVLDEKKGNVFTIDVDSNRMIIAPKDKISFDAFLRFFATIVENFDPQATVEEFV